MTVFIFSILFLTIFATCGCKGMPENSQKASANWEVSMDHRLLLGSIINTTEPGENIIFFSSHSFFIDLLDRYSGEGPSITWVVPDKREITQNRVDDLSVYFESNLAKNEGFKGGIELKLDGGVISGKIHNFSISIVNIDTFDISGDKGSNTTALFADSTFPYPLYRNEVTTPMIRLVLGYGSRLVNLMSRGVRVHLFDNDRALPPKYRYFSRYIREILANPTMIGKDIPRGWWLRANGEYLESFFQLEDALNEYLQALETARDDPALHFQVAFLKAKTGMVGYEEDLKKSYELDESFFDGFLEIARILAKKGETDKVIALLAVGRKLRPSDPRMSEISRQLEESKNRTKR